MSDPNTDSTSGAAQPIAAGQRTRGAQSGAAEARRFPLQAASLAANTRCHDAVVVDLGGRSPGCDYFVIASGTSAKQVRTVADQIAELGERADFAPSSAAGYEGDAWI